MICMRFSKKVNKISKFLIYINPKISFLSQPFQGWRYFFSCLKYPFSPLINYYHCTENKHLSALAGLS